MRDFKVAMITNDNHPTPDWVAERFGSAGIEYVYHECHTREELEKYAADADVLMVMSSRRGLVVEENMDIFKKVGAVIKCGSGTDNIEHEACTKRGIIVAHTPDDVTEPTSDHTIAMLFTAVRQTARLDRCVRRGIWDSTAVLPIGQFTGAALGVIGLGRIGRRVVQKLSGFDMNVRVYDPYLDATIIEEAQVEMVELEGLLKKSQYVIVSCPLTNETRGLLGQKELHTMRSDAVLVNCARAGIVDEVALLKALKEGWIKAAAVDVVENSPLKPGDELLALDNLIITPHAAGHPHDHPESAFPTPVDVVIEMSKMRLPKWIANQGVQPKWNMT